MLEQMFCFNCTYDFVGRGQGSTEKWMDVLGRQSAAKLTSLKGKMTVLTKLCHK